jgi:hypothetical protein
MKFVLSQIPMPPSSNRQYWATAFMIAGKPTGRLAPSTELKQYVRDFAAWAERNSVLLAKAKKFIRDEILLKDLMLQVDTYACFPGTSLWTQKGMPKKMDATNRLKALHDCLSEVLAVDDSWFWGGHVEKIETRKEPYAFVVLKPFKPRAVADLNKETL